MCIHMPNLPFRYLEHQQHMSSLVGIFVSGIYLAITFKVALVVHKWHMYVYLFHIGHWIFGIYSQFNGYICFGHIFDNNM